jgi:hypothetical protein
VSARDAAERLLAELLQAGAIPAIEADRLRIDAPPRILTADRRERLAGCLPELRTLVATRWRSRGECIAPRPCRPMTPCAEPQDGRPCLMPATCCRCGGPLPPGRRYVCATCSATSLMTAGNPTSQGAPS